MSELGGNVVWWILLGLSVVAITLLCDGLLASRRARIAPPATAEALAASVKARAYGDALRLAEEPAHDSLLAGAVTVGIRRALDDPNATASDVRSSCEEAGNELSRGLYMRVQALGTLGAIAPLVGVLGTALSLGGSLGRIAAAGESARTADIAAAAATALSSTVLGLLVAVPSLIAASLLRARLDSHVQEAGRRAEEVLKPLGRR